MASKADSVIGLISLRRRYKPCEGLAHAIEQARWFSCRDISIDQALRGITGLFRNTDTLKGQTVQQVGVS
ncbi:MAG: hypothetical protein A4E57_02907 [Syntrophorhabdaceae bacterium PtaU1.Bin034]|nr:MAG: hypothetical protein A4E57_02907 [Syntrophorhabdaceae bacterium PtaU1.Bin034]